MLPSVIPCTVGSTELAAEIKFESTDHALEVLLLANQYGVDKLRNAATQFLNNNSTRYVNEISHDWEKLEEVYYLADTLDLKALKVLSLISRT